MGIMDYFSGNQDPSASGILGGIGNFAQNNSAGLIGLGTGLLSGNNWSQGLAQGGLAFNQGNQQDKKRLTDAAKNAALAQLIKSTSGNMDPATQTALAADPELAQRVVAQQLAPPSYDFKVDNAGNLQKIGSNGTISQVGAAGQFGSPSEFQQRLGQLHQLGIDPNSPEGQRAAFTGQMPEPKQPTLVDGYDANGNQVKGTFTNGQFSQVGGAKADPSMKPSAENLKAANFQQRATAADQTLSKLDGANGDVGGSYTYLWGQGAPNKIRSDASKDYDQAKREFVNSVLRKESGAVISPSEFDEADKQYFPQAGDGPQQVAQKAESRKRTIAGLAIEANGQGGSGQTGGVRMPNGAIVTRIGG